jgi:hypothetical protein
MPPTLPASGLPRSAAVVNAEIRQLWVDPRVPVTDEQRARRDELYMEWLAAVKAEVVKAA